ncbi:energy transducer TonB [Marinilabilia rubra]|uniref:Energy transducer TonB n=1 Tax=Marinilabilia rubra TaxID=2162893 RepID=A0A2U2BAM4_9BACT|nr:energy transducer TonB [Marinilabilia rubra]PWE00112.1 energy transducer TonB [Marinilabilia rubra]
MKNLSFYLLTVLFLGLSSLAFAQDITVNSDVDRAPKFKGKPSNPEKFLDKYMNYPEEARLDIIEGVVNVSFMVTNDGKLMEPQIEKSVDPLLDSEALRLVSLMQEWKPAKKGGEFVDARVSLSVPFELSREEKEFFQLLKNKGLKDKMPLFVIDDKIVKEYIRLPQYNVKSIRVMKGQKAIDRFGPEAKNGVVIVTTKRGTPPVK